LHNISAKPSFFFFRPIPANTSSYFHPIPLHPSSSFYCIPTHPSFSLHSVSDHHSSLFHHIRASDSAFNLYNKDHVWTTKRLSEAFILFLPGEYSLWFVILLTGAYVFLLRVKFDPSGIQLREQEGVGRRVLYTMHGVSLSTLWISNI
jgi:hypothetical protein